MAKNEKKKNHRTSILSRPQGIREVKQSFLIVCEGMCTEPDYFKAFRMTTATIKTVGQGLNTISLVNKAISIRDTDMKKKHTYDQCWVVFDNQAIALAERNGFRVAYSNQAFEYWFLLHFNLYRGPIHRNSYADMLTKLTGLTYSKTEGFGGKIYNRLLHLQPQAIRNATAVMKEFSQGNPAMEESSTTVHQLVMELNKYM